MVYITINRDKNRERKKEVICHSKELPTSLADPSFDQPGKIDLLIGCNLLQDILTADFKGGSSTMRVMGWKGKASDESKKKRKKGRKKKGGEGRGKGGAIKDEEKEGGQLIFYTSLTVQYLSTKY